MRRILSLLLALLMVPAVSADHAIASEPECPQDSGGAVGLIVGFVGALECASWDLVQQGGHVAFCFLFGGETC